MGAIRMKVLLAAGVALAGSGCGSGGSTCLAGSHCYRSQYANVTCEAVPLGRVAVGTTTTLIVSIRNLGNVATTKFTVGPPPEPFGFAGGAFPGTGGTCGASIAAGKDCIIVVRFSPPEAKAYPGIAYNVVYAPPMYTDMDEDTAYCGLDGIGTVGTNPLTISPESPHDFGSVSPPSSSSAVFTMTNTAGATLPVACADFEIFPSAGFGLGGGSCCTTTSLTPGGSCTIGATFTPDAAVAPSTCLGSLYYGKAQPDVLSNRVELFGKRAP
jgi:hypothetical protein